ARPGTTHAINVRRVSDKNRRPNSASAYAQQMARRERTTRLALFVSVTAAAAIAVAATARADTQSFQSPSGNIYCVLDSGGVACDISDFTYQPPPPPECGKHLAWGNRFSLMPGKPAAIECHGDT